MKKWVMAAIAAAGVFIGSALLLTQPPTPAKANVPCSLPFNLTNSTIADATQVMANYNAIVTCLTQAALAGANSDITQLLGLTTPLSPNFGGSSVYIGGTSTNSGNNYTIISPSPAGFTLSAGKMVSFLPNASNTGAVQINVNSTGLTNLFKQTSSGPAAMTGGEVVLNQTVLAFYDGTQFECLTCSFTAQVPTGTVQDFSGPIIPSGYLLANGQTASRTGFSALFNAVAFTAVSATTTNTSTSVAVLNSSLYQVGWYVGGTNITCNSFIANIPDGTHIVLNNAAFAGGATTLSIGPYQQGDCSTTFNLPNYVGRFLAGVDGSVNITGASCANATTLSDHVGAPNLPCGAQQRSLTAANLPTVTTTDTFTSTSNQFALFGSSAQTTCNAAGGGACGSPVSGLQNGTFVTGSGTGTSNNTGAPTATITLPPTSLTYKIIKT